MVPNLYRKSSDSQIFFIDNTSVLRERSRLTFKLENNSKQKVYLLILRKKK